MDVFVWIVLQCSVSCIVCSYYVFSCCITCLIPGRERFYIVEPDSMSCVSNKVSLLEQQSFPSCASIIVSKVLRVFLEVIYDIYVICELTGNKRRIYSAVVDGEKFGAATVDWLSFGLW